jgi:hypothetical protein
VCIYFDVDINFDGLCGAVARRKGASAILSLGMQFLPKSRFSSPFVTSTIPEFRKWILSEIIVLLS